MLRVLTLNVSNPPAERAKGLLEWLWHQPDEVLVLTEVGKGPGSRLIAQVCRAAGYSVLASDPQDLGVLVVGRDVDIESAELPCPMVLPGRVCAVHPVGADPLLIVGVYGAASDPVRYSSKAQRERKREWLTAYDVWLREWLPTSGPSLMIGDLNLVDPQHDSTLRYVLAEETATYHALSEEHGLVDAYRAHHPDGDAISWVDHSGAGCRYDHAFASPDVVRRVTACDLDHEPRVAGLTDHSALRITLS
ncbi:endonuclease/exonuclease/phosphatase family protein [Luteipulveratus mongoliensis]|uniref:Endonuclease/exonuclease/phosphatase domain-containing protein n=1 Tax=Luteipulveratus mongoliensis TaxID=571913 RepID=A0A0K1JEH7_9MICO|nr:endonuclease/exonuclease/phosphatase family protein [Luteipulveratus mongoliensis]AKU15117.1 hypothetical protein VV02_03310 [Luteipulveratus mongoliensis]